MLIEAQSGPEPGKMMQRRTLLLFALFVVTAWFYSSMAHNSTDVVVNNHQKQIEMLNRAEDVLSGTEDLAEMRDQG